MSKRLRKYLRDLLILGIGGILSGGFFTVVLFSAEVFWSIFYMLIKVLTVIITYILVNHIGSGGNVNIYFTQHELNEDEKKLDRLIVKYRSKVLVGATAVLFIIVDLWLGVINYNPVNPINFNDSFGLFIGTFAAVGPLLVGIKYLSAWWNIKKNWKE